MNAETKKKIGDKARQRWAERRHKQQVQLVLPDGVSIGPKPDVFEIYRKGKVLLISGFHILMLFKILALQRLFALI